MADLYVSYMVQLEGHVPFPAFKLLTDTRAPENAEDLKNLLILLTLEEGGAIVPIGWQVIGQPNSTDKNIPCDYNEDDLEKLMS